MSFISMNGTLRSNRRPGTRETKTIHIPKVFFLKHARRPSIGNIKKQRNESYRPTDRPVDCDHPTAKLQLCALSIEWDGERSVRRPIEGVGGCVFVPGSLGGGRRPPVELDAAVRTGAGRQQWRQELRVLRLAGAVGPTARTPPHQVVGVSTAQRGHLGRLHGQHGRLLARFVAAAQVQLLLERVQLPHEVEVGRNVGLAVAHHVERVVQTQVHLVHEVCDGDGNWAGDASKAVDQHALLAVASLVCGQKKNISLIIPIQLLLKHSKLTTWVFLYLLRMGNWQNNQ